MNDEGIGIAGWLMADLVLVLALVFLALTPGRAADATSPPEATPIANATPVAAPVVRDIGCRSGESPDGWFDVSCTPDIGGGGASSYTWEAEGGSSRSSNDAPTFDASFSGAGAVRLTVSNVGGTHGAAFPVLPPSVVAPLPECSEVRTDFHFAQIVLTGVTIGAVRWADVAAGRVRDKLIKSQEDDEFGDAEWSDVRVGAFLAEKQGAGERIALVETFSHGPPGQHIELSRQVNDAFYEGLPTAGIDRIFVADDPRDHWFAAYRDATSLEYGEVRLNLYFVKPIADEGCW